MHGRPGPVGTRSLWDDVTRKHNMWLIQIEDRMQGANFFLS